MQKQRHTLVVEDSASMRELLKFTLNNNGFNVKTASNGKEALSVLKGGDDLSLVITDINMPEMDGIELIKKLRASERYKFTPILVLTTEGSQEMRLKGKEAGASGWLAKPFEPKHLMDAVSRVLR